MTEESHKDQAELEKVTEAEDGSFFDNERYFAEEYNEHDEEDLNTDQSRKWLGKWIPYLLAFVMLGNILAFWPQVYNIKAIQFLKTSFELSQNENVQQYKQAVVMIEADNKKGTGFNVSANGLIITNEHVIGTTRNPLVSFAGGEVYRTKVIASDPEIDIAVLQINEPGVDLPTLEMDTSVSVADATKGEAIYVIGNPLFFKQIANEGIVLDMVTLQDWDIPVMLLDAPIYKGNSGSPVINEEGKVIAVVFATIKMEYNGHKKNLGLAIPIEYVRALSD